MLFRLRRKHQRKAAIKKKSNIPTAPVPRGMQQSNRTYAAATSASHLWIVADGATVILAWARWRPDSRSCTNDPNRLGKQEHLVLSSRPLLCAQPAVVGGGGSWDSSVPLTLPRSSTRVEGAGITIQIDFLSHEDIRSPAPGLSSAIFSIFSSVAPTLRGKRLFRITRESHSPGAGFPILVRSCSLVPRASLSNPASTSLSPELDNVVYAMSCGRVQRDSPLVLLEDTMPSPRVFSTRHRWNGRWTDYICSLVYGRVDAMNMYDELSSWCQRHAGSVCIVWRHTCG